MSDVSCGAAAVVLETTNATDAHASRTEDELERSSQTFIIATQTDFKGHLCRVCGCRCVWGTSPSIATTWHITNMFERSRLVLTSRESPQMYLSTTTPPCSLGESALWLYNKSLPQSLVYLIFHRYLSREDVAQASLTVAQREGGSVRVVTKQNVFTKRSPATSERLVWDKHVGVCPGWEVMSFQHVELYIQL